MCCQQSFKIYYIFPLLMSFHSDDFTTYEYSQNLGSFPDLSGIIDYYYYWFLTKYWTVLFL